MKKVSEHQCFDMDYQHQGTNSKPLLFVTQNIGNFELYWRCNKNAVSAYFVVVTVLQFASLVCLL